MFKKFLILLFVTSFTFSQGVEIVRLNVSKSCKKHIHKKQAKNQLFTKVSKLVSPYPYKIKSFLGYYEGGLNLFLIAKELTFNAFDFEYVELIIDSKKIVLNDITSSSKKKNILDEKWIYQVGYSINEDIINRIKSSSNIVIKIRREGTSFNKDFTVKKSELTNLKNSCNCFQINFKDIKQQHEASLKEYEFGFRKTKWGFSSNQILESETIKANYTTKDLIGYSVTLDNNSFKATYYLVNNKLFQGIYSYNGSVTNKKLYLKYMSIKKILTKKYGTQLRSSKGITDDIFKDNDVDTAIRLGNFSEKTFWETKNTMIQLTLTGEGVNSTILLSYKTKDQKLLKESADNDSKKESEGF